MTSIGWVGESCCPERRLSLQTTTLLQDRLLQTSGGQHAVPSKLPIRFAGLSDEPKDHLPAGSPLRSSQQLGLNAPPGGGHAASQELLRSLLRAAQAAQAEPLADGGNDHAEVQLACAASRPEGCHRLCHLFFLHAVPGQAVSQEPWCLLCRGTGAGQACCTFVSQVCALQVCGLQEHEQGIRGRLGESAHLFAEGMSRGLSRSRR